jgi:tetratricopeptide (TPR) repeat protein
MIRGSNVRLWRTLAAIAALWAAPALGEPAPIIAPAAPWVLQVELPAPSPAQADKPIQTLLVTAQSRYGEATEHYAELATRIQNAQGLAGMGSITLPWQPERGELIVNKVNIIRDGKVIDLLAAGQTFTVLRRENNLESAMLTGVLTAVMQPEGIQVGDILDVAFTIRERHGALPLRGENFFFLPSDEPVRRLLYRQVWSDADPMRWRGTEEMAKPRIAKTRWGTELVLDLTDPVGPKPPQGAPPRFMIPTFLELSQYRDWSEISRLMAPAYAAARTIGPDSLLRAEIARIAAASEDPRKRALAALRLVQDKIRYLALVMGEGGLVPASADQTWTRKFGDCKGKTATLLALLDGLGIEAEPVAVSSAFGPALVDHLPRVSLFDHVIVRARIDGRSLWLDGTRQGDRTAEDISSYPFGSGLPLRTAGAALEPFPLTPPGTPLQQTDILYDASKGFDNEVIVSGTILFRGETATLWRIALARQGEADIRDALKSQVPNVPDEDVEIVSVTPDEEANIFSFAFKAKTRMAWARAPSSNAIRVKFSNNVISWEPGFDREDGSDKTAPFALPFPSYYASRETMILPAHGAGYRIEATNFDREVAGTRIARTVTLEDGKAVAVSTFRRLRNEIGASEAGAAATALAAINADTAYVRSPENYASAGPGTPAAPAAEPRKASDFVSRGYDLLRAEKPGAALADFDRAAAMEPAWSRPVAGRGVALITENKLADAEAALARAAALNESDADVHQGYGMLNLRRSRPLEAERSFNRAIELRADGAEAYAGRSAALAQQGRLREALSDIAKAFELDPRDAATAAELARLEAAVGEQEPALTAIDNAIRLAPASMAYIRYRGDMLARFGKRAEAVEAYGKALALVEEQLRHPGDSSVARLTGQKVALLGLQGRHPEAIAAASAQLARFPDNVTMLAIRCRARANAMLDLQEAARDCERAVQFDPGDPSAVEMRAFLRLRMGQYAGAIADYEKVLAMTPLDASALYGRGIARLRSSDKEGGERDLGNARRLNLDVETQYRAVGITPSAQPAASN